MSLESHVTQLQRKHEALKAQISAEQSRPGTDALELTSLKKKKLRLKEQIERCRRRAA